MMLDDDDAVLIHSVCYTLLGISKGFVMIVVTIMQPFIEGK